jgi:hypothetical protein
MQIKIIRQYCQNNVNFSQTVNSIQRKIPLHTANFGQII